MKANDKIKLISQTVLLGGIIIFLCYFSLLPERKSDKVANIASGESFGWKFSEPGISTASALLAYSNLRDSKAVPQGLPVRLKIPIIGVDSLIEDALITPDGRMDVPQGSLNVAWFALGPRPGQVGSAVIGGHFGIRNGVKFVFYDLNKLVVGDKIYIENDKGEVLVFQVRRIKLFDRNADATTVFTSSDGLAHLNLITCEGIWNRVDDSYPDRRVVFTDAIPTEPIPPFRLSSEKIVAKAKEIATVSKIIPEPSNETILPSAGEENSMEGEAIENVLNNPSAPFSSASLKSAESLPETPLDKIITVLLVTALVLGVFKLVKTF